MIPTTLVSGVPALPNNGTGQSCAFSPDGQYLAVVSRSSPYFVVLETATWSIVYTDPSLSSGINYVRWTKDSRYAVICGNIGFGLYDSQNSFAFSNPASVPADISHMALSGDGRFLVTVEDDIRVFETSTWTQLAIWQPTGIIEMYWVDVIHDGSLIAVAGRGGPGIRLVDFDDGTNTLSAGVALTQGNDGFDRSVAFGQNDAYLYGARFSAPKKVVWDLSTGAQLNTNTNPERSLYLHPVDGSFGAIDEFGDNGVSHHIPADPVTDPWTIVDTTTIGIRTDTILRDLSFSSDGGYMALAVNDSFAGIEVYETVPTASVNPVLADTTAFIDTRYGTDYLYKVMEGGTLSIAADHGVVASVSGSVDDVSAAIQLETFNSVTIAAVLEGTDAAINSVHEPTVRKISMVGTLSGSATSNFAIEDAIRAVSEGTVTTFYNPQEEPVLAGVAALKVVVAYVEAAVLAGTAQLDSESSLAAAHWLAGRGELTAETDLQRLFEDTLTALAGDSTVPAFAALANEIGQSADSTEVATTLQLMDALAASLIQQATMTIVVSETLEAEAGDSVQALGHYSKDVTDMAGAWLVFKVSGEVVEGWVMNVEGERPFSEYSEFDFNSMTRIGSNYFAATDDGLYSLGGDTDDGDPIDARVSSMMLDFDTTAQKRVVAAYLGYTSDGTVMLKVRSVDDGKLVEHWYEATEVTADAPREGYRPLGRGLKSRYWQFEIANVDGADFEIDKLELQPIKLRRRV